MTSSTIRTPDQRLRIFISSTLGELAAERAAVRNAVERLKLLPVLFEQGARPHPARALYRAYLAQSHVFLGIYWQRYGWVAEGEDRSGLEDEYRLAGDRPRLLYIKEPAPDREERLTTLITSFQRDDKASYKRFRSAEELAELVSTDLALLLSERFEAGPSGEGVGAIPTPLTQTVGRAEETELIVRLLAAGKRLVTITGPGGVGKTRLAIVTLNAVSEAMPAQRYFVSLQSLRDAALADRVIVDALGLRSEGAISAEAALINFFSGRQAVLVLDNLEQIGGIEGYVRRLLERLPELQILAASRRALRIAGEQEMPLRPLQLRPGEALREAAAVQLFIDRASEVNPAFAPADADVEAIAEICRRVDGLPLAIELAAARSRIMAPPVLLERLSRDPHILQAIGDDRPERHQTLQAALEWSYQLLSPEEQRLLARLSVFEDGFSLDAAEAVGAAAGSSEVLHLLDALVGSSLVSVDQATGHPEPRLRMLRTVADFAREKRAAMGEEEAAERALTAWISRLTAEAQPFLCGPHQARWATRLDQERANLRTAVVGALRHGELGTVVEIVWDVAVYYEIRDASEEPRGWIATVVAREPAFDPVMLAKLRSIHALFEVAIGRTDGVAASIDSAIPILLENGLSLEAAVSHLVRSELLVARGDLGGARQALAHSIELFQSVEHDWGVARTKILMSLLRWTEGDTAGAMQALEESLVHSRRIENEPQIARALSLLSVLTQISGAPVEAPALLRQAASIVVRGRYLTEAACCLEAIATSLHAAGRTEEAERAARLAAAAREHLGIATPRPVAVIVAGFSRPAEPLDGFQPDAIFAAIDRTLPMLAQA